MRTGWRLVAAFAAAIAGFAVPGAAVAAGPGEVPRPPGENPGSRGYEKVTPADKGGLDAEGVSYIGPDQVAADGNGLLYSSAGVFAGSPSGGFPSYYRARRGAGGWSTVPVSPPGTAIFLGSTSGPYPGRTPTVLNADPMLERLTVESNASLAPSLQPDVPNLYQRDVGEGPYELLTPGGPSYLDMLMGQFFMNPRADMAPSYAGATPNGRYVLFRSQWGFTDDATVSSTTGSRLYMVSVDGVQLISKLPPGSGGAPANGMLGYGEYSNHNAVSRDGRRVYFTIEENGFPALHLWEDGGTVAITPNTGEGSDAAHFRAATPDGSKAIYMLGGLGAGELWRYDTGTGLSEELAVDDEPADGTDPEVVEVLAASEDLEFVYFSSQKMIIAGQDPVSGSARGLYVWHDGEVRHIGTLENDHDAQQAGPGTTVYSSFPVINAWATKSWADWTPDGNTVVFDTSANLTGYDGGGFRQVYRYDFDADRMLCLSCPDGPATGHATVHPNPNARRAGVHAREFDGSTSVTRDGRRVFFSTPDALVERDVNGKRDVYLWEDGEPYLISDGVSAFDADFVNASTDGDEVFFATAARLVGSDTDDLVDIYDARVDGGFPEPPAIARPGCSGDDCQNRSDTGQHRAPGSVGLRGAGDLADGVSPTVSLASLSLRQRRLLAGGGTVTIRARANRAGVVRLTAHAKVRGRARVVGRASARIPRAGIATLRVRLSETGRVALRRAGRLAVRLEVRFGATTTARTLRLTSVKRKASSDGR